MELLEFRMLSPKCTPSRTGQYAGRYYHNVRPEHVDIAVGPGGLNQSTLFDRDALFPTLKGAGYLTGVVGKLHNAQAQWFCRENNKTTPFSFISKQCEPCGGYYRTEYVVKHIGDPYPTYETIPGGAVLHVLARSVR